MKEVVEAYLQFLQLPKDLAEGCWWRSALAMTAASGAGVPGTT